MLRIVEFKDRYIDTAVSNRIIIVKSMTSDVRYKIRCGPYECSCPAYSRFSSPWMKEPYGPGYTCKHMKFLLTCKIPEQEMLSVLSAVDGDIQIFTQNYSYTQLLILHFRQLIAFDNKNLKKVIVL